MNPQEFKELGEKIASGTATQEEILAFSKHLDDEVSKILNNLDTDHGNS